MSFMLMKNGKAIGELATNKGLVDMREYVHGVHEGSVLDNFLQTGSTPSPNAASLQALTMSYSCKDQEIRETLLNLNELLHGVTGTVLITAD